ncbi:MAG: hypothetical protein K0R55_2727 [Sporomusa sp.]|jgi:ABC-2 type transport system permease protein|nr:hypothetical protein [Sporomusa sp.]
MKLSEVVIKELRYIFFVKRIALLLFGVPLGFAVLFGLIYSTDTVESIPTVIYDQAQSSASRSLIQAFADSQRFRIVGVVNTQEEMEQYILNEEAIVAVGIPFDFSKQIKLGHGTEVLLEINAANIMYSNMVLTFGREIITTYNTGVGQKLVEGANEVPQKALRTVAPVSLKQRLLYNPTNSYLAFLLPGLVANGVQIGIILCVCTAVLREFGDTGLWRTTSSTVIIAGKLLAYWLCSLLATIISIAVCIIAFKVMFRGSMGSLLLICSAFTFMMVNLGLLLSAMAQDERMPVHPATLLYIMPSLLYSGYNWPHIAKSSFVYAYSLLLPMTYAAETIRDILLAGYSPDLLLNSAVLYVAGSIACLLTIRVCMRRCKSLAAATLQEVGA